jgi:UDP-N-acetylglucosamine enolpyruvyl transferase
MTPADSFIVTGGRHLKGELIPQGAKNEALQVLCACLLTDQPVTFSKVPAIRDVFRLLDLLRGLGVKVTQLGEEEWRLQATSVDLEFLGSEEFVRDAQRIRGSVMLIGPLLARFGRAFLPKPGGDKIGRRRLDTHFVGIQKLGGDFVYDPYKRCYLYHTRLRPP